MIELKTYKMVDEKYCTDCVCVIPSEVYLKKDADKAIEELNKKLMPCLNGDCILTCEVVEKYGKENAELKQKLEDAKATAYTESVDAGMRERKLRRALYKACANWADVEVFERTVGIDDPNVEANRWVLMRNKCLKQVGGVRRVIECT